jgi:hypothetical protein
VAKEENGHQETVACENRGCNNPSQFTDPQGPNQEVHEQASEAKVQEHGVTVGLFRGEEVKKESKRVKNRGFKVGPEGHSSKDVGIPVRDLMMKVYFVVEELFDPQIKGDEVVADQKVPRKDDLPEEIKAEQPYHDEGKDIFLIERELHRK